MDQTPETSFAQEIPPEQEQLAELRSLIYRGTQASGLEIAAKIPHLDIRTALRDRFPELPVLRQFDLSQDAHFATMIVALRMNLNSSRDFEADLGRICLLFDAACKACAGPRDTQPRESADPSATSGPNPSAPALVNEVRAQGPIRIKLFEGVSNSDTPGHLCTPALLGPAPDERADMRHISAWLSGEITDPHMAAISIDADSWTGQLTDMEVEFRADPQAFFDIRGVKPRQDPSGHQVYQAWIREIARAEIPADDTYIRKEVKAAIEAVLECYFPHQTPVLSALGAQYRIGEDLYRIIGVALDIEASFLEDGPQSEIAPQHPFASAIHPSGALGSGIVLRHAFARHFLAGAPLDAALAICLIELREAQLCLLTDQSWHDLENANKFEEMFMSDCRRPLEQFIIQEENCLEI